MYFSQNFQIIVITTLTKSVTVSVAVLKMSCSFQAWNENQLTMLLGYLIIPTNATCYQTRFEWQFCLSASQRVGTLRAQRSPSAAVRNSRLPFSGAMATNNPELIPVDYTTEVVIQQHKYELRVNKVEVAIEILTCNSWINEKNVPCSSKLLMLL